MLWSIFLHKRNLDEVGVLRERLRARYQLDAEVVVWDYLGWGAYSESLRIEKEDLARLDKESRDALSALKPESEWIALMQNERKPPFKSAPLVIHLVVEKSGDVRVPYTSVHNGLEGPMIGNVFSESVDTVLHRWRQVYAKWAGSCPPISALCARYGDGDNKRLYNRQSILRKWCAMFEAQN